MLCVDILKQGEIIQNPIYNLPGNVKDSRGEDN